MFEPRNVVLNIVEFSEMSEWLGQRYPHLDAISRALLFRKLVPLGDQSLARRRHVISCVCRGKPILQLFYKRT
jgi:hypothetical protein